MAPFIKTGNCFYAIAMIVFGAQHVYFGNFSDVFFPPWQQSLPLLRLWACIFGLVLIAFGLIIIFKKNARKVFLSTGTLFLVLFFFAQIPYEFISQPNRLYHFGIWADPLEEVAYAGGAFIMAGTGKNAGGNIPGKFLWRKLERLISYGNIFFCFVIAAFGVSHFLYTDNIAMMVPGWIPDHRFWTFFGAVALIGSNVCIVFNIRRKLMASLLSLMIFSWFLILHLPDAYLNPIVGRGNELASAATALLFSGTALVIAFGRQYQVGDHFV